MWARKTLLFGIGLLSAAAAGGRGFDFAALRDLIETRHLRSVEAVLAELPPTLRHRYALVFASRSLQEADYRAPRVILYGADARLVVTFNGNPEQRGFATLEVMEFDDERREFRFREIVFPTEVAAGPTELTPVKYSAVNPDRCRGCHGATPRPVWDTHPLWPGAYGQRYEANLSAPERAGLVGFLAVQKGDPRYRQLLGIERFAAAETFRTDPRSRYVGTSSESPNAELAALLTDLAVQSVVRELRDRPGFPRYQYALLGLADERCGAVAEFLPSGLWREAQADFQRFTERTRDANAWQLQSKLRRLAAVAAPANARGLPAQFSALIPLRFIAERGLGEMSGSWTLALEKGTYDFTAPPTSRVTLRDALLAEVADNDPQVRELSFYATSSDGDRYCNYLKRRSRVALSAMHWDAVPGSEALGAVDAHAPSPPDVVQICAACHESGVGPRIPFRTPAELSHELVGRQTPHGPLIEEVAFRLSAAAGAGQMPLGVPLTEEERLQLQNYFRALAAPGLAR